METRVPGSVLAGVVLASRGDGILRRRFLVFVVVAALLILSAVPAGAGEVIAVLNFAQRDDDPQHAWLSKGLADLLINQLSDLPGITVVSRDRMQTILGEYQQATRRTLRDLRDNPRLDAKPLGRLLTADRMAFGTYGVDGDKVVLTVQVSDIASEKVLYETHIDGVYKDVLDLERQLARRLRAYLLGADVETVPLKDVPQWTSKIGAAEHLYVGVDLFDQGRFAEAWYRFRQAQRVDAAFADAVYWQGRMFYYLMVYENARPLLEQFFTRWPLHPRAGDAAIELLDSYRQTESDPERLRDIYAMLRERVDRRTIVHNKTTPGAETQTLLRTYIGGFLVEAERSLGHIDAAADLAIELMKESREAFEKSNLDGRHWGFYEPLAMFTGIERRMQTGKLVFTREMINPERYRIYVCNNEPQHTKYTIEGDERWVPVMVKRGDRYRMSDKAAHTVWFIAPEGYIYEDVSAECWIRRSKGSTPFLVNAAWGLWDRRENVKLLASTDQRHGLTTVDLPPNTRMFALEFHVAPDFLGSVAGTEYFLDEPYRDYVERAVVHFRLKPLPKDVGHVRVSLANAKKARIYLDGYRRLPVDGIVRNVTPGRHALKAEAAQGKDLFPSDVFDSVEQEIVVEAGKTTDARLEFPFRQLTSAAMWMSPRVIGGGYPAGKLPPKTGADENCRPCLLRVRRGPLTGRLVALWSHREELWASYSMDDGRSWTPTERLPIPVNSAHQETAPQLIQDESGQFCLMFVSDRNIQRAFYPYVSRSWDLERWTAPKKMADVVCDSLSVIQDSRGRYLALVPPPFLGTQWDRQLKQVGPREWTFEAIDISAAYGDKYARKRFKLYVSDDFIDWTETPMELGGDGVRDGTLLQTADGVYHAVYTRSVTNPGTNDPIWSVVHQTSRDMAAWEPEQTILEASWDYRNPVITTDGSRVFGSVVVSGNNVHRFNIGEADQMSWWGMVDTRNVLYHDPPEFGNNLHWLWICFEGNPHWYQPNAGKVYYTQRPSDRGEWLFTWPKTLPPLTPDQEKQRARVLALSNHRQLVPDAPWTSPVTRINKRFSYSVAVPDNWHALDAPMENRAGYLCPARYGQTRPYFDVSVMDAEGAKDVRDLGLRALRRWSGSGGTHVTLEFPRHANGLDAYLLTYEIPWGFGGMIVTKKYGFLHDGKEYRLNARCPVDGAEQWMPVFNRILDSFRFIDTASRPGSKE